MEKSGSDSTIHVEATLKERKIQHGPFKRHARIELHLRHIQNTHGQHLSSVQRIALGMIMHKIARILNEGHAHSDTWHDIAGYAILAEQDILNE